MRRFCAVLIGLACVVSTSGVASADPYLRPATNQQAIEYVLARGLSQRGVPYTYGGGNAAGPSAGVDRPGTAPDAVPDATDPGGGLVAVDRGANVVGFDASGLIVYAFAGVGVKLPRSSGEQYNAGMKVVPSQALPGDLIFYGPDGSQSVAMYLGNNQMLEATDPAVTISPVRFDGMTPYLARIIA